MILDRVFFVLQSIQNNSQCPDYILLTRENIKLNFFVSTPIKRGALHPRMLRSKATLGVLQKQTLLLLLLFYYFGNCRTSGFDLASGTYAITLILTLKM